MHFMWPLLYVHLWCLWNSLIVHHFTDSWLYYMCVVKCFYWIFTWSVLHVSQTLLFHHSRISLLLCRFLSFSHLVVQCVSVPLLQQSVATQRNIRINIFSVPCPSVGAVYFILFFFLQIMLIGQHFTPLLRVCIERQTSMLNYNGPKFIMIMCCVVKL
jgi:hypothetical protein